MQGTFLTDALRNYGKALAASREPDLRAVFTVVSLWFNNQGNPEVNGAMEEITRTVSEQLNPEGLGMRGGVEREEGGGGGHYNDAIVSICFCCMCVFGCVCCVCERREAAAADCATVRYIRLLCMVVVFFAFVADRWEFIFVLKAPPCISIFGKHIKMSYRYIATLRFCRPVTLTPVITPRPDVGTTLCISFGNDIAALDGGEEGEPWILMSELLRGMCV